MKVDSAKPALSQACGHSCSSMLPDPCKPSLPLLAKTMATLGTFHSHQLFSFTATVHSQPYFWLHVLSLFYSFSTQIPLLLASFAVEAVASLAGVPCLKLAFLLLLGSLLLPTLLLLHAFLLLLGCHKLVSDLSDCMAHGHFHGHHFFRGHPTCKTATFLESHLTPLVGPS